MVVISRAITRETILITHIRGLKTPRIPMNLQVFGIKAPEFEGGGSP